MATESSHRHDRKMVKLHFIHNQWSDVSHIWQLWSADDCLPSLYVLYGHFVWLPLQHSILKKDFFKWQLQNHWSSMTLFGTQVAWVRAVQNNGGLPLDLVVMTTKKLPLIYNGKMVKLHFYAQPKKWQVYYVVPSDIWVSFCLSGWTSKV